MFLGAVLAPDQSGAVICNSGGTGANPAGIGGGVANNTACGVSANASGVSTNSAYGFSSNGERPDECEHRNRRQLQCERRRQLQ